MSAPRRRRRGGGVATLAACCCAAPRRGGAVVHIYDLKKPERCTGNHCVAEYVWSRVAVGDGADRCTTAECHVWRSSDGPDMPPEGAQEAQWVLRPVPKVLQPAGGMATALIRAPKKVPVNAHLAFSVCTEGTMYALLQVDQARGWLDRTSSAQYADLSGPIMSEAGFAPAKGVSADELILRRANGNGVKNRMVLLERDITSGSEVILPKAQGGPVAAFFFKFPEYDKEVQCMADENNKGPGIVVPMPVPPGWEASGKGFSADNWTATDMAEGAEAWTLPVAQYQYKNVSAALTEATLIRGPRHVPTGVDFSLVDINAPSQICILWEQDADDGGEYAKDGGWGEYLMPGAAESIHLSHWKNLTGVSPFRGLVTTGGSKPRRISAHCKCFTQSGNLTLPKTERQAAFGVAVLRC